MRASNRLLLALVLLLAIAGCGSDRRSVTVYAAASLTDVFEQLGPGARFNFGGSDALATQIEEGAEADVFASAGAAPMARLRRAHLVDAPFLFATNRIVAVVAEGDTRVRSIADLAEPGTKVVLAAEGVPAGDYARELLAKLGLREAVLANVVSVEPDVRSVLGKVALGEADAGFVYATDVRDGVRAIEPPARARVVARYYAAPARGERRGREFLRRLVGREGRDALREHGFGLP